MARPTFEHPTPGELAVLQILWERGPSTGREVMAELDEDGKNRAYTSVTSLLNVMTDKRLVRRNPDGRTFVYEARVLRDSTLTGLLRDMVGRAFEGSASALVAQLLADRKLSKRELEEIRRTIEEHTP